jgi:transmembrane sensor
MSSESESRRESRRAAREATDWLIVLREEPNDRALARRFEDWRAASAANAAAWAEVSHVDDVIGRTQAHAGARRATVTDLAMAHAAHRSRRWLKVGAVAAVAACLMLVFGPGLLLWLGAAHTTSVAEVRAVPLDDGSMVRLAPQSAIDLAFDGGQRRVVLLKGQAFFEVKPDTARPFVVQSGDVFTTALGTSFDVRLTGEGTDVAVRSGTVRVTCSCARDMAERLTSGDRLHVEATGQTERTRVSPDEIVSWADGVIVARDRSVSDVIDEVRRSYRGAVVITDGRLARERVTGVYQLADPVTALKAVASAHGAAVTQISPWLVVVSRD